MYQVKDPIQCSHEYNEACTNYVRDVVQNLDGNSDNINDFIQNFFKPPVRDERKSLIETVMEEKFSGEWAELGDKKKQYLKNIAKQNFDSHYKNAEVYIEKEDYILLKINWSRQHEIMRQIYALRRMHNEKLPSSDDPNPKKYKLTTNKEAETFNILLSQFKTPKNEHTASGKFGHPKQLEALNDLLVHLETLPLKI